MIVQKRNVESVLSRFEAPGIYGLDTESYGLGFYDRLFSIILSDDTDGYYFNFLDSPDHLGNRPPDEYVLDTDDLRAFQRVLQPKESTWCIHNAKFDMRRLDIEGLTIEGGIHCTEVCERVLQNNKLVYSLDSIAKQRGLGEKDDAVEKYIKENGLYSWVQIPGKKKREKDKHFHLVPFDIIAPYGVKDAVLHRRVALSQREDLL